LVYLQQGLKLGINTSCAGPDFRKTPKDYMKRVLQATGGNTILIKSFMWKVSKYNMRQQTT